MGKIKGYIISILIPNAIGFLGSLIGKVKEGFKAINKPAFTPPKIVFPIAWTILYTLMGISSYMIYKSNDERKGYALILYAAQLILNSLWTYFFFNLKWFLFSFILVLIILAITILMFKNFYKINKTAAYLQIPYILWLIFAAILSFSVYKLN